MHGHDAGPSHMEGLRHSASNNLLYRLNDNETATRMDDLSLFFIPSLYLLLYTIAIAALSRCSTLRASCLFGRYLRQLCIAVLHAAENTSMQQGTNSESSCVASMSNQPSQVPPQRSPSRHHPHTSSPPTPAIPRHSVPQSTSLHPPPAPRPP